MSPAARGSGEGLPRRVVIVGGGVAGLYTALRVRAELPAARVVLIAKSELRESNTWYAQGGIAAVLPEHETGIQPEDSVGAHAADTLAAGAGLCSSDAVRLLCEGAPAEIRRLRELGVAFDVSGGVLSVGREAAHSAPRILHIGGDATGAGLASTLIRAVRADRSITVLEQAFVEALEFTDAGRLAGVAVRRTAGVHVEEADAVVLATGGGGQLYASNTNSPVATADGVALAWRAGAVVADLEFFQFHPTALDVPGHPLISEAVRGEGAVLLDSSGSRFLQNYSPAAELAPRDVVSRSIALHLARRGEQRVYLDATGLGRRFLERRFPSLSAATARCGFDWAREPLPVAPAAHYWMGGVRTDTWGRTSVPGLYAVGETACTGVHGANRLASNSLLEALVFGARTAAALAAPPGAWPAFASTALHPAPAGAGEPYARVQLQRLMSEHAGVVRDRSGLELAQKQLSQFGASGAGSEAGNLLLAARLLVHAAAVREESRGAHYRADYPQEPVPPATTSPLASSRGFRSAAEGTP